MKKELVGILFVEEPLYCLPYKLGVHKKFGGILFSTCVKYNLEEILWTYV